MGASVKKNIIANYSGQIFISLLGILVVPVYIKFLGIETYGLIGFLMTISAAIVYLDLGLSTAANREIARRANSKELVHECHEIVRTLEIIYLCIALIIAGSLFLLADFISTKWLNSNELPADIIKYSIIIHGITLGIRWPITLYTGVLRGLEKQILLNTIVTSITTFNRIGSIIIIVFVTPSIIFYLLWILAISFVEVLVMYIIVWRNIPHKNKIHYFSKRLMREIGKFSFDLTFTSLFATIIKQMDKIVISKLLPLEQMGYYMTASTVTNSLIKLVEPTTASIFPRMSSHFFQKREDLLSELYHKSTQLTQIFLVPLNCIAVFFSYDILLLWTQSETVASNTHIALSVLSVALFFNTALQPHYILVFASGLTWIPLACNFTSSIVLMPIIYYSILEYGINGAGFSWVLLNFVYFFMIPRITHSYILREEYYKYIFNDSLYFILSGIIAFSISFIISHYFSLHGLFVVLLILLSIMLYIFSIVYFKPLIFNDICDNIKSVRNIIFHKFK